MAATEELLGQLHELVAQAHVQRISAGLSTGNYTAADLTAAANFLDKNHITCAPTDDNTMGELQKKVEARRAKRKAPVLSVVDSATIMDDIGNFNIRGM